MRKVVGKAAVNKVVTIMSFRNIITTKATKIVATLPVKVVVTLLMEKAVILTVGDLQVLFNL